MTLDQVPMNSKETEEQFRAEWEHEIVHPFREKVSEMLDCCNVMTERMDRIRGSPNSRLRLELLENENLALRIRCSELEAIIKERNLEFPGLSDADQRRIDEQLTESRLAKERTLEENLQLRNDLQLNRQQLEEARNQVELLSIQLLIYKEDFDTERQDRERIQGKVDDMEQQLKRQNEQPSQRRQHPQIPRQVIIPASATFTFPQLGYNEHHHHHPYRRMNELTARGYDECDIYQTDCGSFEELATDPTVSRAHIDGDTTNGTPTQGITTTSNDSSSIPPINDSANHRLRALSSTPTVSDGCPPEKKDSVLHCPSCRKPFALEDHMLLLDHLEECRN